MRVAAPADKCSVFWGTHGCDRPRGHRGTHWCSAANSGCCKHPRLHWLLRLLHMHDGCVGAWPYYGKITRFYRSDVP